HKEAEELASILAKKYKVPYLDLSRISIDLEALKIIPEATARSLGMAVVQAAGKRLQIAVKNPTLEPRKEKIEDLKLKGYTPQIFLSSLLGLERVWERYKEIPAEVHITPNVVDITRGDLEEFRSNTKNIADLQKYLQQKIARRGGTHVTELLEYILAGAYLLEASDVHIETEEEKVRLRLRLDGLLQLVTEFPHEIHKSILSRIKLVSNIKLNIHDRSQDGRFTIRTSEVDVEVRVSTLPGPYGESVVMRILHPKAISLTFENLGMQPPVYKLMEQEIKKPNGMIITTGPTGSGKTTTLYAFVKRVREEPGIKIITIEDPIEYHLEGISQTQTNKTSGYTFESGLSAIVRQDPDVILVGEIRNKETAEIAMHASLTGHLVFSTLHTNSASGTIPRLIDLGIAPNIIAPAINVAIAQRLLRVLCAHCKKPAEPAPAQKKLIEKVVGSLPPAYERPSLEKLVIYEPGACDLCSHTGYKGRVGIYEAFLIDDAVERLILKNPSEAEILEVALKQGLVPMAHDGVLKIIAGTTSFSELERMVGAEEA
ncbi:MAG: type II/IV secretion system protein, partial [Candidatus Ryanbacteria bacterium]|nr:type II/IV secretion system protein [Candidatus Ryanbacteria bacterium]